MPIEWFGPTARLINKTGAASVRGTIVEASDTTDYAFKIAAANGIDPIGVVVDVGIADGDWCTVQLVGSVCQVLLEDSTASTRGNWAGLSASQAGRADCTDASPPSQTRHFQELGHCIESVTAGTDKLAYIIFHTN